jgi:uncharacterized membrane protein YdbT with pleckstrin-like domain
MAQSDSRLMTGEEIVFSTTKHWLAPVADSWKAVLFIIGSLVLAWLQTTETEGVMGFVNRVLGLTETVLMLGGILLIVYNFVNWRSAKYMVTNQRVLGQEGLARKRETDSLLSSISDVGTKSSLVGRIFGYGSIKILSASGETGSDTFTTVRKVDDFKKRILEQKVAAAAPTLPALSPELARLAEMQSLPTNGHGADQTQVPNGAEVLTTLAVLASLRDAQTITTEEYEAKKTEMLARI